jgi:hypothetical protein
LCVFLCLAGLAHGVVGTKKGLNNDQIQLKEHVTGTITRIGGSRIRVAEDDDQSGCAAGIRFVDIVDSTKLFRGGRESRNRTCDLVIAWSSMRPIEARSWKRLKFA